MDSDGKEYEAEWGSSQPVRFLNPDCAAMYDSAGEVVLCKCGKPAGAAAIGKEAFIAWCSDCSPYSKEECKVICRNMPMMEDNNEV